jgi:FlaA1/EpsC-like NDP-sugar epimerase
VIPIFRRQIEKGGPITVTHPEMTRFFMTIPEAASLVIQSGAIGGEGDVFVLDMGDPVKIVELAEQMIRLSGKDPDEIGIDFVGARPGEKLHEELWGESETVLATTHPKIRRVSGPVVDAAWLEEELGELDRLVEAGETLETVSRLAAMSREPRYAVARDRDTVLEDTLH